MRLVLRPFRNGQPLLDDVYYSGSPEYPPPSGEAIAWCAFSAPHVIDEVRAMAIDRRGNEFTHARLALPISWQPGPEAPPMAAWVATLAERREALSRAQQPPQEDGIVAALVMQLVFLLVPASIALQIVALLVLGGLPKRIAWASAAAMVGLWLFVIITAMAGSNPSPIWLVFLSPAFVLLLAALLAHHWLLRRRLTQD